MRALTDRDTSIRCNVARGRALALLEAQIGSKLDTYDQAIAGMLNTLRELMNPLVPEHRGIGCTAGIERGK